MQVTDPSISEFRILCKTFEGLEEVLANEIRALGLEPELSTRAVLTTGTYEDVIRLNIWLRCALNVSIELARFDARDPEELYNRAAQIKWSDYFKADKTFSISHTIRSRAFDHSQFAALKLKDAIVDAFRKAKNQRPSVDKENADVRVHLHIQHEEVSLWFDTSGQALYKRGYRLVQGPAPLNEVLAAGLVALTGWDQKRTVVDPMCGTGTLGIEAAFLASGLPPSWHRDAFAYHALCWFDADMEKKIMKTVQEIEASESVPDIYFSDMDERAIAATRKNLRDLPFKNKMIVNQADFFKVRPPVNDGLILLNPPYGERMQVDDLKSYYQRIGDTLKHQYAGCTAWIITSALSEAKFIGLKPKRKIRVFNGPLESRWLCFDMYPLG